MIRTHSIRNYILPAILILAALFRFTYLGHVPAAVNGDELHYAVTAKSIWLTGHDISGTWSPWSLLWFRYPPAEHQAELPYLLHLVTGAAFPFSMFLLKLPFALLSLGVVLLLYLICRYLFGWKVALATAGVAAVNPWLIVMGRSAYEATPAMFFYLLALLVILRAKQWHILRTIIPLVFAFYSYIATKVILVPYVVGISLLAYLAHGKQYLRQYIFLTGLTILIAFGFYYFTTSDPAGSRLGEIFLPNSSAVTDAVNQIRKTSITAPFVPFVINKFTVYFQLIFQKIFRVFSPSYLFLEGDQFFLPGRQSFLYWVDAILLFIGIIWMYVRHRGYAWIFWLLIAIGSIPQLINTTAGDFSIHVTMVFPFLLLFIGAGIVQIIDSVPKRLTYWAVAGVILLYAANVANFSVIYFLQYPLIGKSDFPMRVLTHYIQLTNSKKAPVIVYTTTASDLFQKYILYADVITKANIQNIVPLLETSDIEFNTNRFISCKTATTSPTQTPTEIYDAGCDVSREGSHVSITTLVDGGETYKIYNDVVCGTYSLKKYPDHIAIQNFDIEHLSEKDFCEIFISQR